MFGERRGLELRVSHEVGRPTGLARLGSVPEGGEGGLALFHEAEGVPLPCLGLFDALPQQNRLALERHKPVLVKPVEKVDELDLPQNNKTKKEVEKNEQSPQDTGQREK